MTQIFRQLAQATQVFENVTAILKTLDVPNVHIVGGKCLVDGAEGIYRGAVGIENDQSVIGIHGNTPTASDCRHITERWSDKVEWFMVVIETVAHDRMITDVGRVSAA
jgi:hypothetical protein